MGFGYIAVGLFFLFNPNISIFDIIPDFIGYLLIYRGLYHLSFPSGRLQAARQSVAKLVLVTAAHFFSILLLPLSDGETFSLTLVFVFAVLETMFLIPAILSMFEGFYELGTRFNVDSVYDTHMVTIRRGKHAGKVRKVEGAERLKVFTIVFFLIKTVANVLPELTALQVSDEMSSDSRLYISLSSFKPLFYLFFSLIVLAFGVIWLVRSQRYLGKLRRDTVLQEKIAQFYEEKITAKPGIVSALRMRKVRVLLVAGAVLSLMLILDGVNVLPNIIACACVFAALVILYQETHSRLPLMGMVASVLTGALSLVNLFLQIRYFDEYEAMAAHYIANASVMYRSVRLWGIVEYILLMVVFLTALLSFAQAVKKHTAFLNLAGTGQYSADDRRREIVQTVRTRLIVAAVFAVIYSVASAAYFQITILYSAFFLIDVVIGLVWVGVLLQAMRVAHEYLYERLEFDY